MFYRLYGKSASLLRKVFLISLPALALSCLLISGCNSTSVNLGKDVLATVDGEPITVEDLKAANGEIPEKMGDRKDALGRLINNRLAARAAVKEGFANTPAVLGAIEGFYNDRLPEVLTAKIQDETQVTDEELTSVKAKQDVKPVLGVSLLVAPTMEEAESAMAELRKGADFQKTAAKYTSVKGEPEQEISLGEGLYPAGIRAVLNRMKPGELSPIMKTEVGYAIFKVNYRKEQDQVWKEREDAIRAEVKRAKAQAELARLVDKLRSSADLKLEKTTLPGGEVQYTGAVVNGLEITMDPRLFNPAIDPHFEHSGLNPKTLRDALNRRINEVLLSQEARRRGLDQDPEFKRELALKKEEILASAILEKVKGTYSPTEKEIRDYYEKNKARFASKAKVRISRILLPTKEQAEAALKEVRSGKDFASVAKAMSTDPSSKGSGGDVGFVTYELLKEPLRGAIANLKVGETSGVLKTDYGYEVLKATGRVEAGPPAFSLVSSSFRKRATLNKISERVEAFYGQLNKKSSVKINEKLLASLKK